MQGAPSGPVRASLILTVLLVALASALAAAYGLFAGRGAEAQEPRFEVLLFSKTAGFRHDSIPAGIAAIETLGRENGFAVDATEDASRFTDENLERYEAVVFLSTTGDFLNEGQQAAFERYIRAGGGYAGIHAAADGEYEWSFYGGLVGAYFKSHPHQQQATVEVEDTTHPSTAHLNATWSRYDEWYNYQSPEDPVVNGNRPGIEDYSPRGDVHVLASLDEGSYIELDESDATNDDHPIAWCQDYEGGRSFYTGGGHTGASYAEEGFLEHLLGGIETAAGAEAADCGVASEEPPAGTPSDANFEQVTLAKDVPNVGEPNSIAVLPDGSVLHTARDGRVFLSTVAGRTSVAAELPVYRHDEEGLQGIALDPNFEQNRWVYLYYAPPLDTPTDDPSTPGVNEGDAPFVGTEADFAPYRGYNRLSRFRFEDGGLDLGSEQELLRVEADRGICCHAGGEIDFDAEGNLYLSTGDDTNPFQDGGYTPIDERETRNPAFDAQRTSSNTNDLRGKILRITPTEQPVDGRYYTVPAGNLFDESADAANKTRPEIYAMGFRNPFRFGVDPRTGHVYVGDYGPDAAADNPTRGPSGRVEFDRIREAGNYGWPYCIGDNSPYNDYDFQTQQSGPPFDCDAPVNRSPNNTGLEQLPAAEPAWIYYNGDTVYYDGKATNEFGSGGEAPMGGPVYNYDPNLDSENKLPEYYDGRFFAADWDRGWIKAIGLGPEGQPSSIEPFFASATNNTIHSPMDLEFGPDGSLYVMDYGTGGYFAGDENSAVYKINYVADNRSPVAESSAAPTFGTAPLTVDFSSEGSRDPDGDALTHSWDFDGDGTEDSTQPNPTHTYDRNGDYTARLTVTDPGGKTGTSAENVTVGNSRPDVELELPPHGAIFGYGDRVPYRVEVTDPEDGSIDCSKVRVVTALGHNEHAHGDQDSTGCSGSFTVPPAWEPDTQYSFYIVAASYTDGGGPSGGSPLTGSDQAILQPRNLQAEHFSTSDGVVVEDAADTAGGGGKAIGRVEDGDNVSYDPIDLLGIDRLDFRVSSLAGGTIEARLDSPTGRLVGSVEVSGSGPQWRTVGMDVADPGGTHELFLVFENPLVPENPTVPNSMFSVNFIDFVGRGAFANEDPTVAASAQPASGQAPLAVAFSAQGDDPDGDALSYRWDFGVPGTDADGATTKDASYTYTEPGTYTATVTASDGSGATATDTVDVVVEGAANAAPAISGLKPRDGAAVGDRTPTIGATVTDDETQLRKSAIRLRIDGKRVEGFAFDRESGKLRYVPAGNMGYGVHDVEVTATDADGGSTTEAWSFRVVRR